VTLAGAEAFLTLRSYVSTARKQGMNPLAVLRQLLRAAPGYQPRQGPEQLHLARRVWSAHLNRVRAQGYEGPCQRFARNCATRNLASPRHAASSSTAHLGVCEETCGYAGWYEPPAHQWHARGQGFKSPQLHHREPAGQRYCAAIPLPPTEPVSSAWGRIGAANTLSATARHSSTAAKTRACISGVRCR
jgi:hypothetical protein